MKSVSVQDTLRRIQWALDSAVTAIQPFVPGAVEFRFKAGDDPVTEADHAANRALRNALVSGDEGWLSEESEDDFSRLHKRRVWVVDPLDGTREFVAGIPEWCISIGLIENGQAVAGGICNPATGERFIGHVECGLVYNDRTACCSQRRGLNGATVLASRSEVKRGEWASFQNSGFVLRPMGSVAYKLARVAAGLADATWTLCPKHEWDVAAGVALVNAAGGFARRLDDTALAFNNSACLFPNLVAGAPGLANDLSALLAERASNPTDRGSVPAARYFSANKVLPDMVSNSRCTNATAAPSSEG